MSKFTLVLPSGKKYGDKWVYFAVSDSAHVYVKSILPSYAWEEVLHTTSEARTIWKELTAQGYIPEELYNEDVLDQSKPLSMDNCKHRTSFEGRCEHCGWLNPYIG